MEAFLDHAAFRKTSDGAGTVTRSFVSQANLNGCISFSNWPRQDVEKLLPTGMELARNVSTTPDVHPVAFIFGDLTHGATMFGGFTFPTGIAYQEFALAIPFVKHRASRHLHTYIPRMYSSYFPPTWSGNAHYGFAKEMASLRWQGSVFLITTDETLLLHAAVEATGNWTSGSGCELPNFAAMSEIFCLPVVGRRTDGADICSFFGWDFSAAAIRPADAYVSIDAPLCDGLSPRRCHDVPSGTFEVCGMIWRLSWPSSRCFGSPAPAA